MYQEITNMLNILSEFLGKPKSDYVDLNSNLNFEFNCPRCAEENGFIPDGKYNLSVNLAKGGGLFQCWRCSTHSDDMRGRMRKLFTLYGTDELWAEYKRNVISMRESEYYKINYGSEEIRFGDEEEKEALDFPYSFRKVDEKAKNTLAYCYLRGRGIDDRIIRKYGIGYTSFENTDPILSHRIVVPSYNAYGELNYWVARDYTGRARQRYANPRMEKKDIIFGESLVNWDNDITLCEGVFDAIVVPNAIPLLGKSLTPEYRLYQEIMSKARGRINIFLDGDDVGVKAAIKLYKLFNNGKFNGNVRYVIPIESMDPSEIYQKYGRKGIIHCLSRSTRLKNYVF